MRAALLVALALVLVAVVVEVLVVQVALSRIEDDVVAALGGTAVAEVTDRPAAPTVLTGGIPALELAVTDAVLEGGLVAERIEVTTPGGDVPADLQARITPEALTAQLRIPGVDVLSTDGRLVVSRPPLSLPLEPVIRDDQLALVIPGAPPLARLLEDAVAGLLPDVPEAVDLVDARADADGLVLTGTVDLQALR